MQSIPGSGRLGVDRLQGLLEIGRGLVTERDLNSLLDRLLLVARELTGARYAAVGVLDERHVELERFVTSGIDPATHAEIGDLPRGRGVLGVLIDDPRPLRLADVGAHPRSYGFPAGHPRMSTFLGVPIVIRGEPYGNLYLTEKDGGEFSDADEETALVLADWAAIAIENARAFRRETERRAELERAVRALEATTTIAKAIGRETDLARVLELIVKRARAFAGARAAIISLLDGDELVVSAVAGETDRDALGLRVPVEGSVGGLVVETRRSQRLTDVPAQVRFGLGEYLDAGSGLFVPLVYRSTGLGVLAVFDRVGDDEFTADDERLMESFAASAATAVATAQSVAEESRQKSLEASERERRRWARELHDETLQELAALKLLLRAGQRTEDPDRLEDAVDTAVKQLEATIGSLRHLIAEVRPLALDELGLEPALMALAERVASTSGVMPELDVSLGPGDDGRLVALTEETIYRLAQEALTNAVKHANATSIRVAVTDDAGAIRLSVADDGDGFDPAARTEGFGLLGMRERVELAGGTISIESRPGVGTTVRAKLPTARPSKVGRLPRA